MGNKSMAIIGIAAVVVIGIVLVAAYALSGNDGDIKVFNASQDNATVTVKNGETFKIALDENPSTGYSWNVSVTSGLQVVDDKSVPPDGKVVGAGNVRYWQVKATGNGDQQFTAVNKRPWEPTFGNETSFRLTIKIL